MSYEKLTLDEVEILLKDSRVSGLALQQLGRERFGATASQVSVSRIRLIALLGTFVSNERTHDAIARRHLVGGK